MLSLWARVDLGALAMKGLSTFPKAPGLTIRLFSIIIRTLFREVSYPSAEVQSVYYTAPTDWTIHRVTIKIVLFQIIQLSTKQFYFKQFSLV